MTRIPTASSSQKPITMRILSDKSYSQEKYGEKSNMVSNYQTLSGYSPNKDTITKKCSHTLKKNLSIIFNSMKKSPQKTIS